MTRDQARESTYVSRIQFVGRDGGAVKNLAGFRKQHHTVPDAVNDATSAFLAKLCAAELAEEGESMFQRARSAFGYKRKEISLEVTSPGALLKTPDFTCTLDYSLDAAEPSRFCVTRTLWEIREVGLLQRAEFGELFAGCFSAIAFELAAGVRVEAVIDAVEALDTGGGLTVSYPSDCRSCTLAVDGVTAEVVCDGATLEMRFARAGSPLELAREFLAVREAFALTKSRVLATLI